MANIERLKLIRKRIDFSTPNTKKKIFAYITANEQAHYTITASKILINLNKLSDSTIAGIINLLDCEILNKYVDI